MEAATAAVTTTIPPAVTLTPKKQPSTMRIEQKSAAVVAAPGAAAAPPPTTTLTRRLEQPNQQQHCSITITNTANNLARTIISGSGSTNHNGVDRTKLPPLSMVPIPMISTTTSIHKGPNVTGSKVLTSGNYTANFSKLGTSSQQKVPQITAPLTITATGSIVRRSASTSSSITPRTTLTPISKINQQLMSALPSNVANSITITAKSMPGAQQRSILNGSAMLSNAVAAAKAAASLVQPSGSNSGGGVTTNIIPPGTTITKIPTFGSSGGISTAGLLSNSRIIQIKPTTATALTRVPSSTTAPSMHVATKPLVRTASVQTQAATQIPSPPPPPPPQQLPPPIAISILDAKVSASAAKSLPFQFQHLQQYMSTNPSADGIGAGPSSLLKTTNIGETKTIFITKGRNTLPPVDVTLAVAPTTNVVTSVAVAIPRPITTIISNPKPVAAVGVTAVQSAAATSTNNDIVEPKRISVQIMNGVLSDPKGPIQLLQSSVDKATKLPVPELLSMMPANVSQSPRKIGATIAGTATSAPTSPKSDSDSDALRLGSPTIGNNRRRLVAAQPQSPRTQSRSQSLMVPPIATAPKFKRTKQRLSRASEPTRLQLLIKAQLASDMADAAAASASTTPAAACSPSATASPVSQQPDTNASSIPSPPFESLECTEQMDDRSSTASGSAFVSPERAEQQQMRAQTVNNWPAKASKRPTDAEMEAVMTAVAKDAAATTTNERTTKTDVLSTVRWCKGSGYLPRSTFCLQTNEFMLVEPMKRVRSKVNATFERSVNDEASFKLFRIHSTMRARPYPARTSKQQLRVDQRLRLAEFAEQMGVRNQQLDAPATVSEQLSEVSVLLNASAPPPFAQHTLVGRKEINFNWDKYLFMTKSIAAPVELFTNAFPTTSNGFEVRMKLESIDPMNNSRFCVCTVLQVIGYRLRLAFDGFGHEYAFWVNADSTEIYPPGWCTKTGRALLAPPGTEGSFDWHTYLQVQQAKPAPRTLFTHLMPTASALKNPFRAGMKLEADDLRDTNKLCVATVGDVINNRVLIKLDGYDERFDYWTDYRSPYLHPVNWHQVNGFGVTAPPDFKIPFNWDTYLMATKARITKPEHVHTRKAHAFQVGMKLEVVDRRNPQLIRPATIMDLIDFDVKVLYDGWPEGYAYWLSDDHPDMHPVNWCARTGHPLEPPPSPQYHNQPGGCSSFGCRSIGNANDPDAATHVANNDCPYFMKNWKRDEKNRPNRLHRVRVEERRRVDRERYAGPQPRSKRFLERIKLERSSRSSDESVRPTPQPMAELRLMATVTPNGIIPNNTVNGEPVANAIRPPGIGGGAHAIVDHSAHSASAAAALKSERANSLDSDASHNAASGTHNAPSAGEHVPFVTAGGNHRWVGPIQKDPLQYHRLEATQHILHDYLPTLAGTYNVWRRNACSLFRRSANDGDAMAAGAGIAPGQAHGNPMVWTPENVAEQVGKLTGCEHVSERFVEHEIDGNALLTMSQADLCGMPLQLQRGQAVKVSAWTALLREDAHTQWLW